MSSALTRRHVLKVTAGFGLVAVAAAGCDGLSTEREGDGRDDESAKGGEAPQLARMVEAGDLPPLAERLPDKPMVVEPVERPGVYGGEWNQAMTGPSEIGFLTRSMGYENLVRWDPEWKGVIPNLAESFEVNETATEYTFYLRPGMRWSDGEPFDADDIVFWFEDVMMNDTLTPVLPEWLPSGDLPVEPGGPPSLEKEDAHTVRFSFPTPHPLFIQHLATNAGFFTYLPRHYFEQFHEDYNPAVVQLAEEEGFEDWTQLFASKGAGLGGLGADFWRVAEVPTLHAWILTSPMGEGDRVIGERNPYYWKVDPENRQLPYLDRVVSHLMDPEVMLIRALSGEIDMQGRYFNALQNKPVLARDREVGQYRFYELNPEYMNTLLVQLNLTHNDPIKREIFGNVDFRIGLSYAVNRPEIIDAAYQGQGEPYQAAPRPGSNVYNETLAKQYTEYDVTLANEHLDRAGYAERDANGFRIGPDGKKISFTMEFAPGFRQEWASALELVQRYWREVGIDARVEPMDRGLFVERTAANQHDAAVWIGHSAHHDYTVIWNIWSFLPHDGGARYGPLWAQWYESGGQAGEEPPEAARRQLELYDQLKITVGENERADLMNEILHIAQEQFYCLGISLPASGYGIVKENFHNVPDPMIESWEYPTPAPTNTCQYFIE